MYCDAYLLPAKWELFMNKMVLMAIKGNERKGSVKGTGKGTGQDGMTITKLSDKEKKNPCLHLIGVNRDSDYKYYPSLTPVR